MTPALAVSLSFALSALAALALAPAVIRLLGRLRARQTVLGYVVQHEHKTGTPTMGGGIFLLPAAAAAAAFTTEFSLICAALADGSSVIANLHFSDDVKATLKSLKCIGASWRRIDSKIIEVTGTAGRGADGTQLFECGESGSTLRFFIPIALALYGHGKKSAARDAQQKTDKRGDYRKIFDF